MSQVVLTFTIIWYECELQSPMLLLKYMNTFDSVEADYLVATTVASMLA